MSVVTNRQSPSSLFRYGLGDPLRIGGVKTPPGPPFFGSNMFLLYMDASGTPELVDPNCKTFVMGGMCLHEGGWFDLENRVRTLKAKYCFDGCDFELHAKDFCVWIREQDLVPDFEKLGPAERRQAVLEIRKQKLGTLKGEARASKKRTHRLTDPFIHLARLERSRLFEDALDLVGNHDGIRLFSEAIDKDFLNSPLCIQPAFAQVVSRFDAFLVYHNASNSSGVNHGLLVMDKEPTYEKYIEEIFARFRDSGHPWGPIRHVIESPFFIDSRMACAVQIVDLCTYAVRRYLEKSVKEGSHEEQNFLRIFHKFDRSGPKLHGLRHYCPKGSCGCLICVDRGHSR